MMMIHNKSYTWNREDYKAFPLCFLCINTDFPSIKENAVEQVSIILFSYIRMVRALCSSNNLQPNKHKTQWKDYVNWVFTSLWTFFCAISDIFQIKTRL